MRVKLALDMNACDTLMLGYVPQNAVDELSN